ncbi:MAG: DUF2934 domain-containing protein [Proteobacteria bacterium]|nr:DUF2934 domain-containing protein [Pseudomonadota bacterium]
MADNPLKFDADREHRIRARAYHLWETEGKPEGRAVEFWERAAELVGMEDSGLTGQIENPIAAGIDPTAPTNVEEAEIQQNLGEFPDRLADQGEWQQTPKAKKGRKGRKAEVPEPTKNA